MNYKNVFWKKRLVCLLPMMVFVFCLMQPILDVAGFWQGKLAYKSTFTTLLRMGSFLAAAAVGFLLSERKWVYCLTAAVMAAFAAIRSAALMQAGKLYSGEDLFNLAKIYMLVIYTLAFCTFLRKNSRVFQAIRLGFTGNLAIIAAVMLLSRITGTDPYTYPNKQLGVQGWFLYGNPQSAVLSMLVPVAMGWALEKWKNNVIPAAAVTMIGEGALLLLGTRLSCAAMAASGAGLAVSLLLVDRRRWRQSAAVAAVTLVLAALIPVSPMVRNQQRVSESFARKQQAFDEAAEAAGSGGETEKKQRLIEAYNLYVPGIVKRFGGEKALEAYDFSTDVNRVANRRIMRLTFCRLLQEESPASAKWFGMDVTRMKVQGVDLNWRTGEREEMVTSFDPENDFHGIYYLYGAVGLILIMVFFFCFAQRSLRAMIFCFKGVYTLEFAAAAIACCADLAHCVFTASTLRYINASVYLAMILAVLWELSGKALSQNRGKFRW